MLILLNVLAWFAYMFIGLF